MKRHGVISRTELLASGVSSNEVQRRVRGGQWVRLRTGIYATTPDSVRHPWLLRFSGELCWGGDRAALSHRGAAFLYGLDGFASPDWADIVVPASSACRGSHVHRSQFDLPTVVLFDLPVVTPEVCIAQLGHVVSENMVEAALESALRHGLTSMDRLKAFVDGPMGRLDGCKVLRTVLRRRPASLPPTSNHLETSVVQIMRSFGCRSLDRHVQLGSTTFSLSLRKRRLAVSCRAGHQPPLAPSEREQLAEAGWTIVEVAQAEFVADERAVIDALRAAIVQATRQSARQRRLARLANEAPPVRSRCPRRGEVSAEAAA